MIIRKNTRNKLKNKLIKAFSEREEIYQIFFLGGEVNGKVDKFSDIDIIVCSNDLLKTKKDYATILNSISPVMETLLFESSKNTFSEIVMFKNYSPYQKVDLSIVENINTKNYLGPFLAVYEDKHKPTHSKTRLKEIKIKKDVEYKLCDILFSIPRFTKCLFRKDFDMYNRWIGVFKAVLALLYEKHFGWQEISKKELDIMEQKKLYSELNNSERLLLGKIYPLNAKLDIVLSFQRSIDLFITLSEEKAKYFGVELNSKFIKHIKSFMNSEIKRFLTIPKNNLQR
ncbi:MAG: nucleotidyltransferase domain-containing protein [bacterium]|nr:nucleotidyltransferase domain-containing protein [bacterium]